MLSIKVQTRTELGSFWQNEQILRPRSAVVLVELGSFWQKRRECLRPWSAPFAVIEIGFVLEKSSLRRSISHSDLLLLCSHITSRRSDPRIKTYATPAAAWCGHIFHSGPTPRGDAI